MSRIYHVLSIAGTDPSGGAGIQADLKTFSALGTYGTTVITSLVAQNTCGVQSIYPIDADFIEAQMESVLSDVHIDSVKIGMLGQASIIRAVANKLKQYNLPWIILDTVITAKNGDILLSKDAVDILIDTMLPLASIITPNLPEAAILLNSKQAINEHQMRQQGYELLKIGCKAVLIKGGHLIANTSPDWLISPQYEIRFDSKRVNTRHTHGTGCTLSAAMTALRPRYKDWPHTIQAAKNWLYKSLLRADDLCVGTGNGPVHHFHEWW